MCLTIDKIRLYCQDDKIEVTSHMLMRFQQRNILYREIKEVILNGEIIEDYPEDYPYPSCLVFGYTVSNCVLHVVVGMGDTKLWLITAYEPDPDKWSSDFKLGRSDIMETCFFCKGDIVDSISNYMADLDGHFIIIKNVPCHKCSQCGEVSYSGATVARIEEIIGKLKEALTEVAIVDFVA